MFNRRHKVKTVATEKLKEKARGKDIWYIANKGLVI